MTSPDAIARQIGAAATALGALGAVYEPLMVVLAAVLVGVALVPKLAAYRRVALVCLAGVLGAGEVALAAFHFALWRSTQVADPATGVVTGTFAVPLWIESEKLYVWALMLAVLGCVLVRARDELLPGVLLTAAALTAGAALLGHPFTQPLPGFIAQYSQYLRALASGDRGAVMSAYQGVEASRQYYYNSWYMWVHPPLLFLSYGAFVVSFVATLKMISERRSSFEDVAYRWARLGYLPLTAGMLLGFPWAILAWQGEAWWWSGKVNISIMMWLLYTALLHARLYLRRRGMWKLVAVIGVLSFVALALTYVATYVVPGTHSYA